MDYDRRSVPIEKRGIAAIDPAARNCDFQQTPATLPHDQIWHVTHMLPGRIIPAMFTA